jgi:hypothetical protein
MENKLMKEFAEFEGLTDQVIEIVDEVDGDDDDPMLKPTSVSTLSRAEVEYEMQSRNLKLSGFPDTDREELQKAFDDEFKNKFEAIKMHRIFFSICQIVIKKYK